MRVCSTAPGSRLQRSRLSDHRSELRGNAHRRRIITQANLITSLIKPITTAGQIKDIRQGIATFYDESSQLWESMWGEHMHHGYYPKGGAPKTNQQAQIDMVDEVLKWAEVEGPSSVLDVGCGIGGSSRHLVRKYNCKATGITLSPFQANRANEITAAAGLADQASFQVADALNTPFADGSFDLLWSMESGEHMPDKRKFVGELARLCAPGGRIIVVTWCHRVLNPGEASLRPEELELLDRICEAYYLPAWCSVQDYKNLMEENGLVDIKTADWTEEVAPFWGAVIQSALTGQGLSGLMQAGWSTIKGALVMPLMAQGYKIGLIKFNLITARKA